MRNRILVVEDDPAVLEGLRGLLELADYDVLTAANGQEALAVLQHTTPHLILSDIMMPRLDGYGLYTALRARPEWMDVPFIFLTARGEKADIYRGKELGVDDYLVKPFDEADLLMAVRNKLSRRAQLDAARQRQINDLKHSILTTLNHEFRTPLTHIAAYLELLRDTVPEAQSDEFRRFLQVIQTGTERLQRMVEDFILLAEFKTGEAQATFEKRRQRLEELPSLLATVVEQQRHAAIAKGLALNLELPAEPLPAILADREYLANAFKRLVENAIKFSRAGDGPVLVAAAAEAGQVCVRVTDHGRGIRPEELDKIFDLFYQSERSQHEQQGIGTGLTIAHEIAKMHGGALTAVSAPGQGSTFTLTLPAAS